MAIRITALGAALFCVLQTGALGQTAPAPAPSFPTKAERVADVRYLTMETLVAKPNSRLWTIISKHFMPAAKVAGVPAPIVYHTETGKPSTIVITPLKGGTDDLGWSATADDVRFMAALAKQEGGQDKAMALFKEYNDSIESRTRELVHEHTK
ncbi:hypothetical protein [Sphingomonas sp. Y38-1Y]|uniref:hypothetical protein n=1 Tax=Sphingomonas sp. Y38-1Y TaxID=3078265 RepID=UPI0028EC0E54|nr:hypothetical protein [Sphingomonas sp. Y38-1Y]